VTPRLAALLARCVDALGLVQAVRLAELVAGRTPQGTRAEVGCDLRLSEEPAHFSASDRMMLVSSDVAAIAHDGTRFEITTNVMGLAGATPALPAFYSETQLQRRRLKDWSLARFLNIFDHRALSFFYRAFRKHHALVAFEREARSGDDAVTRSLLALSGFATAASRDRLPFEDIALAPLAHHLGNRRRTAAGLELVLRHITGIDLSIVEAVPVWMALPTDAQSRLGTLSARLGGSDPATELGHPDAALLGASVLDIQHHYIIAAGPLSHAALLRFCTPNGPADTIAHACTLFTGLAYRPSIRLRIASRDIPPLQLGAPAAPAYLGRTTWMGANDEAIRDDCVIAISPATLAA